MKWDCEVIQDILPLYVEDMVSDKTKVIVQEHLKECDRCNENYLSMQQRGIRVEPMKADGFQLFKNRILFEIILSAVVELIALMAIFKYVFITNGFMYVGFAVFVFLPLISFLCCFHMSDKSLKKIIALIFAITIISALPLIGLYFYQIRLAGEHGLPSGWLCILGGSFGLIPALIGTASGRWLKWKRRARTINRAG